MKVLVTEYLRIDLEHEMWECRRCGKELQSARDNYKRGLLVYDRDPREIHKPLLDPKKYQRTYSPDPTWCRILEYYCPQCGTMMEAEYLPPGHPPLYDIELSFDVLRDDANFDELQQLMGFLASRAGQTRPFLIAPPLTSSLLLRNATRRACGAFRAIRARRCGTWPAPSGRAPPLSSSR